MEQFNTSLRNFIAMGKNYEKALAGIAGPRLADELSSSLLLPGEKLLGLIWMRGVECVCTPMLRV